MRIILDDSDKNEILRYLGYRNQTLDGGVVTRLDHAITVANEMIQVRYAWKVFELFQTVNGPAFSGTDCVLCGDSMRKLMDGCKRASLFCITIGPDMDREIARMMVRDPAEGVILNACGICAVEKAADALQLEIDEAVQKTTNALPHEIDEAVQKTSIERVLPKELGGVENSYQVKTGTRFSPGYGDLPLSIQTDFLRLLDAERRAGIRLNPNMMMNPVKSVTAVAPIIEG